MIGFVVALEREGKYVLSLIENKQEIIVAGKKCVLGTILKKEAVIIFSGIGKVSAAIATQAIIDAFSPSVIVNFGSAGGVKDKVEVLKYYQISSCCQYDFDLTKIDDVPLGYIQDYDCNFFDAKTLNGFLPIAKLATADRFLATEQDIESVLSLKCDVFDMEGCAIAQVCRSNNIDVFIIKGITDLFGSGIQSEQYLKNANAICLGFEKIVKTFTERIN